MTKKNRIFLLVIWIILIISFLISTTLIFMKVNGFKFNFKTRRIERTGIISLDGSPANVSIFIDDEKTDWKLPYHIKDLFPNIYNIRIKSNDYQTWQENLTVEAGMVTERKNILLFYKNPKIIPNNKFGKSKLNLEFDKQKDNIKVKNNEIWYKDKLITRYSQKVLTAILYPDKNHFLVQVNSEIHVLDLNGSNDLILVKLKTSKRVPFIPQDNGRIILFLKNGKIYEAQIR